MRVNPENALQSNEMLEEENKLLVVVMVLAEAKELIVDSHDPADVYRERPNWH